MGIREFLKGELIEIIEWTDDSRDILSFRFPDNDKAIKNGAQLIVRESQIVQLVYLGEFGDTFGPGRHHLTTGNVPVLTRLKSWKYGLESPFKVDVYFINTRLFAGNPWGTTNPVMMRDDDLGVVRARAFGTYDFRIVEPRQFLREMAGSDGDFRLDELEAPLRARIVSVFSRALAASRIPLLDVSTRYAELGQALLPLINAEMTASYGLELTSFVVENVSVPVEVEKAIDARSSMAAVGDLNAYVKYQVARGMEAGAGGSGGAAAMVLGLAATQQILRGGQGLPAGATEGRQLPAAPERQEVLSPAQVAEVLSVPEADVLGLIESGELAAKRIGASYRIKRSTLDAFLDG